MQMCRSSTCRPTKMDARLVRKPLTEVVESVKDDAKGLKPLDVELWFLSRVFAEYEHLY